LRTKVSGIGKVRAPCSTIERRLPYSRSSERRLRKHAKAAQAKAVKPSEQGEEKIEVDELEEDQELEEHEEIEDDIGIDFDDVTFP
jgi:hypothetical protein